MTYRPFRVRVAEREQLSPHFVRVTFASGELAHLGWDGPDQRIKLLFPVAGADAVALPPGDDWYAAWRALPHDRRSPMRTYTTRYADPGAQRLVVDFVAHGDTGPATRWVNRAAAGDELVVVAPDGSTGEDAGGHEWNPGTATTLLVAADESAVPAAVAILENLPDDARGAFFLEVPTTDDVLRVAMPDGIAVTWLPRDGAAHGELLGSAVRAWADARGSAARADIALDESDADDIWDVPETPVDPGLYAWLAGEAGVITALRRHLVREVGIDRKRVAFMGYWKQGRSEQN